MKSACPGCGVELPEADGPRDPYDASSPACWAVYGEVMAREFSDAGRFSSHGTSVDAYMAQHPSAASRASIQSVWVHLAGLCVVLDRGGTAADRAKVMTKLTTPKRQFEWLPPPPRGSSLTVASVYGTEARGDHATRVRLWGESVWAAWGAHHTAVRAQVDAILRSSESGFRTARS